MDYHLKSVDQVKRDLVQMTKIHLKSWVRKQRAPFSVSDIYADPEISKDLYANLEMMKAIKAALIELNCEVISSDLETRYAPPVRVIDRDLLVS